MGTNEKLKDLVDVINHSNHLLEAILQKLEVIAKWKEHSEA